MRTRILLAALLAAFTLSTPAQPPQERGPLGKAMREQRHGLQQGRREERQERRGTVRNRMGDQAPMPPDERGAPPALPGQGRTPAKPHGGEAAIRHADGTLFLMPGIRRS